MKNLSEKTGGYLIINESFSTEIFRKSLLKLFEIDSNSEMRIASAAYLDITLS